jgi:NMD protein affecting ribosome stability and mRNA decay
VNQTDPRPRRREANRRIAGHAQEDHILDPYQRQQKLNDHTVCPQCGAVYLHGRWQSARKPKAGHEALCPACRRVNDKLPAGIVKLHGALGRNQIDEIVSLARHQEAAEKGEHPLNRIISIDENADGIVISTTDTHLPRRIGEAVKRAFHGTLDEHFDEGGYFVRVTWKADT